MASDIEDDLLVAEDALDLANQGLLSPVLDGKWNISAAAISSTSSTSAIAKSATVYEIPVSLHSKEAYEFIGLTPDTAARRWSEWIDLPTDYKGPEGPIGFLDMVTDNIHNQDSDAAGSNDDWETTMRKWGLAEELISAIMAPECANLRMTESAKVWAVDTVHLRWRALEGIQDMSRERLRKKHGRRKAGGGDHVEQGEVELGLKLGGEKEPEEGRNVSRGGPLTEGLGYTLLWHSQDRQWIGGLIDAEGNRSLSKLYTKTPSDFLCIGNGVLYFTPQRTLAEKHAQYAQRRSACSDVALVWMRVPNELIRRNEPVMLLEGDEWKKIVFASRRRDSLPRELRALKRRNLFIGYFCRNDREAITELGSWREMSVERNVLVYEERVWNDGRVEWRVERRRAVQYIFHGLDVLDELEEEATLGIIGVGDRGSVSAEDIREDM